MKATCWRWIYKTDRQQYLYRRKVDGTFEKGIVSNDLEELKRRVCALHDIKEADLLKQKPALDVAVPSVVASSSAGPSGARQPPLHGIAPVCGNLAKRRRAWVTKKPAARFAHPQAKALEDQKRPAHDPPESEGWDCQEDLANHDVDQVFLSPRFGKIVAWLRLAVMSCMLPPDLHEVVTTGFLFMCPLINFFISSLKFGCVREELRNVLAMHPKAHGPDVLPEELYAIMVELCKRLPLVDFRLWSYHCRGSRGTGGCLCIVPCVSLLCWL
jgi:hypothetical protein